jgi:hypothetical protein
MSSFPRKTERGKKEKSNIRSRIRDVNQGSNAQFEGSLLTKTCRCYGFYQVLSPTHPTTGRFLRSLSYFLSMTAFIFFHGNDNITSRGIPSPERIVKMMKGRT